MSASGRIWGTWLSRDGKLKACSCDICTWRKHAEVYSFIHFSHAPLWVHSAKCRHQSSKWVILSKVDCFIPGEVKWFQVLLDSLYPTWCEGVLVVSSSSARGTLLRSSLHLFHPAVTQCGWIGRDAVLGQWLRGVVARLSILHHHSAHSGRRIGT